MSWKRPFQRYGRFKLCCAVVCRILKLARGSDVFLNFCQAVLVVSRFLALLMKNEKILASQIFGSLPLDLCRASSARESTHRCDWFAGSCENCSLLSDFRSEGSFKNSCFEQKTHVHRRDICVQWQKYIYFWMTARVRWWQWFPDFFAKKCQIIT